MKYVRILSEFYGKAWALPEELLLRMQELLCAQASGAKWPEEEIQNRVANANRLSGYEDREHLGFCYSPLGPGGAAGRRARNSGKVAVIPVTGIISHRMNLVSSISGSGGTSIQKLQAQFREAVGNVDCKAIVLDVDSPGGSVDGVMELAQEIFDARQRKPIIAVCNAMACSAAYWLASAASEVVCTPSGQCGSIGVYMMHVDESDALQKGGIKITIIKAGKYKAEGNSSEPLSAEAHDAFQGMVNDYYSFFIKAVARYRGASQISVREGYGQGRSLLAPAAAKANLSDRTGTLDEVLAKLGVNRPGMALPGGGARIEAPEAPEDYMTSLAVRQHQLDRAGAGVSHASGIDEQMQALTRRRLALKSAGVGNAGKLWQKYGENL